jgi:hypothetical protein
VTGLRGSTMNLMPAIHCALTQGLGMEDSDSCSLIPRLAKCLYSVTDSHDISEADRC